MLKRLFKKNKSPILFFILILTGTFLRIYNLNWGSPFYFHPDERNIASVIAQSSLNDLSFFTKSTFAYGNFLIIISIFIKFLFHPIFIFFAVTDPFSQAIIIIRSISAISSILMLYIIYLSGKLWSERIGFISLFLAVFSIGFVQQAHFGTFDGFIAFASITSFFFLFKFIKNEKIAYYYLSLLFIGIGSASKITLLVLLVLPCIVTLLKFLSKNSSLAYYLKHLMLGAIATILITILLSPYYLTTEFLNALTYERGLVVGTTPVFYTQSFYDTIPVVFQFLHIYPFLINPLLTIIFLPAFLYVFFRSVKTKNKSYLLLTSYFLLLFLPQVFLLAKWTRYMVPSLPFIYLIIAILASDIMQRFKKMLLLKYLFGTTFIFINIVFCFSYLITAFVQKDVRIQASEFAKKNISATSEIKTESYDPGITPFNIHFTNISDFNFYELDNNSSIHTPDALYANLNNAEFFISPSPRLLRSRLINKNRFPQGHKFYSQLINNNLRFVKIYETPCDIYCKIVYLNNPVFIYEETAIVFDRPTVMIYKKIK